MAAKKGKRTNQGTGASGGASAIGGGAGGGNGTAIPTYKVSKIMAFPSYKKSLPNYQNTVFSAGMEIVFDEPQAIDSPLITNAFTNMRKVLHKEFGLQKTALGLDTK